MGTKVHAIKLTQAEKEKIYRLIVEENIPKEYIAQRFNVTGATIRNVQREIEKLNNGGKNGIQS